MDPSDLRASLIRPIKLITKAGYGAGHVLNDLCASMWFTYLLLFYHKVIGMNNSLAGTLLLIGQVADALATPFVGYESDRINGFCKYGKRKSWHLIGCICVAISFPFIFMEPLSVDPESTAFAYAAIMKESIMHVVYYAPFIVIFQFGWASTQISHLSLIPELTKCEHDRVSLNSIRYGMTVISSLAVYGLALLLLTYQTSNVDGDVNPTDYAVFRTLVLIVVGVGVVFAIIFHVTVKEQSSAERARTDAALTTSVKTFMSFRCWFKLPQFYIVGLLYMSTRLVVNVSQVYLSMYLTETLDLRKQYIAIVPLIVYLFGFISTLFMKCVSKSIGKKKLYFFGVVLVVAASAAYRFIPSMDTYPYTNYLSMGAGAVAGIGGSTMLIMSLSMTADLIDHNTESGAFVYGAMSFTDKLSNGIAIQIIQIAHPCVKSICCAACAPFYRHIMTYVPAGFALFALFMLFFIKRRQTTYTESEGVSSRQPLVQDSESTYGAMEEHGPITGNGILSNQPAINRHSLLNSPEARNGGASYNKPDFVVGSPPSSNMST